MAITVEELITRWGVDADGAEQTLKKLDKGLDTLKTGAKIAGAALVAMFGVAVKEAAAFDTAMGEVSTLVDVGTDAMAEMNKQTLALSEEFGSMPVETAKAFYTTISAGFGDAADAAMVLEGSLKLARGGVTTAEIAVDGLTTVLNSYGMSADSVGSVSDKMFVAMKAGKTTIGELSQALGKVTPFAADAGVSLDELLAATSALTLGGLKTKEATTSLRQVFAAVAKPTSEAAKTAKELGINFNKAAIESMGFQKWLKHVQKRVGGNDEAMAKLFGSVEGLAGVLALTGNQAGKFDEIILQMADSAGMAEAAFQKMDKRAGATFDKLKAKAKVFLIQLGDKLLPMISEIAAKIGNWIKSQGGINKVVDKFVTIVKILVGFKLAFWIQSVAMAMIGLGKAFVAIKASTGIWAAIGGAINPVLLVTIALGAALAFVIANMDELQEATTGAFEELSKLPLLKEIMPQVPTYGGRQSAETLKGMFGHDVTGTLGPQTTLPASQVPGTSQTVNTNNKVEVNVNAAGATAKDAQAIGDATGAAVDKSLSKQAAQIQADLGTM